MKHAPPLTLDLAAEFPVLGGTDFFNHAAVAPMSARAARAMRDAAEECSRQAYLSPGWYGDVVRVKQVAAGLINARGPHEIAFIPNTTTGLAMLAGGLDWRSGDRVVITDVEYPANRYPWTDLKRHGVEVVEAKQQHDLRIDVQSVLDLIDSRTRVVSLSHVQYASGFRIDLKPIADAVHAVGGLLCVDAIQSVGVLPVDVQGQGVDFLSADGHKWMLGPEGAGFLYCHEDLAAKVHPPIAGWLGRVNPMDFGNYDEQYLPDARRFEPGCWNISGLKALGASLSLLTEVGIDTVWQRVDTLNQHLRAGLADKGYRVVSPDGPDERSGIVSFVPPVGVDPAAAEQQLQSKRIIVAMRGGRLRASPHFYNGIEQVDRLLDALPV
ncbi:MAG: aminotransferase class V-fold PLP-dependent enzyme [Phycisphaerales bacterium JB063]